MSNRVLGLRLTEIELDDRCRSRARLCHDTIAAYATLLRADDGNPPVSRFPPIIVYYDGAKYLLVDGWLRYHAHKQAGRLVVECEVRPGGLREARLFAASCNATHGLPRTHEDKRRAVLMVLDDPECQSWSAAKIAAHVGSVSAPFVTGIRKSWQEMLDRDQAAGEEIIARGSRREAPVSDEPAPLRPLEMPPMPNSVGPRFRSSSAASTGIPKVEREAESEEEFDDEDDDMHDMEIVRKKWRRAFRKLERYSRALGSTTEQLIAEYRAELQAEEEARKASEPVREKRKPKEEKPKSPFED